jgi:hypothetical protein
MPRIGPVPALAILALAALAACSQAPAAAMYPEADLSPPTLLSAGPTDARGFRARFDEAVTPVAGSLCAEPAAELSCSAEGGDLIVSFASDQSPGADYALAGEVDDSQGNRTRFLVRFAGWNDRAPRLRLSELQTGKNSSQTNQHRDYIELEALEDGNIGGEELSWTSTVKTASYRFPGAEVRKGDFIVLHLAPEGIPEEVDELGSDLSASGGVDASPTGRDVWTSAMALPDASGAVSLSLRPGEAPIDGFFYAESSRSGPLSDDKLAALVTVICEAVAWPLSGPKPAWEDGFRWKSSTARSICRSPTYSGTAGPSGWYVSAASGQSPGAANSGPEPAGAAVKKASAKKAPKLVSAAKH